MLADSVWQIAALLWNVPVAALNETIGQLPKLIYFLWSHLIVGANNLAGLIPICCMVSWWVGLKDSLLELQCHVWVLSKRCVSSLFELHLFAMELLQQS